MPPGALHEKLPLMLLPRKVVQAAICVAARPRTAAPATFERGEALRRAASAPSFPASRQKAWAASSDIESADRLAKPEDRRQARRRK